MSTSSRSLSLAEIPLLVPAAKEVFSRQEQDGFSFDVEDLVIAKKLGLRAVEVRSAGVTWRGLKIRKDHSS
jgi:hypothetical protein